MANKQTQLIIILAAVLLAVMAASGLVIWLMSDGDTPTGEPTSAVARKTPVTSVVPVAIDGKFIDTKILQSARYTTIDKQAITDGTLPVQPPAAVGKANPFL